MRMQSRHRLTRIFACESIAPHASLFSSSSVERVVLVASLEGREREWEAKKGVRENQLRDGSSVFFGTL